MNDSSEENDESSKMIMTNISRKALITIVNFFIMGLIGVISWKFVATNLPEESVGIVHFGLGFLGIFSFITNLGFGSSHVKRISEGQDIGKCIGTFLAIQLVLSLVFALIVISSITIWKEVIGRGFETPAHERILYLLLVYYISNNMAKVGTETFSAKLEVAKNQIIMLISSVLQLIITIIVVLSTDDPFWFGFTFIVGSISNLLISTFLLTKYPIRKPTANLMKKYFVFAIPVFVMTVTATISSNVDKVMVQLFWDATEVALYTGGQKFSLYLINITAGWGLILFPIYSSLKANIMKGKIKTIVYETERLISIVIAPVSALVFSLAIPIVTLLGDIDYRESYLVLQPLVVWNLFQALNIPYTKLIMGIGKAKVLALVGVMRVILLVILNIIFIPLDFSIIGVDLLGLGARGAAIATMLSALIAFVFQRIITYKYEGAIINKKIAKPIAISFTMAAIILMAQELIPADKWLFFIIYALFGIIFYFSIMLFLKGFTRSDRRLLMNIINPASIIKDIRNELSGKKK